MNKKTLSIITPVLALLTLILTALECFLDTGLFTNIAPLLFIATVVCGYLAFKDDTAFTSKWTWVVLISLFSVQILTPLASLLDFEGDVLVSVAIWNVIFLIGWACVFASVLFKKLFKFMPIGFGFLALATIADTIYNLVAFQNFSILSVLAVVMFALMALISFGIFAKINTYLRWVALALIVICFLNYDLFTIVALFVLAILLVPFKRFGFAVRKLVALLCIVTAVFGIIAVFAANPFAEFDHVAEELEKIQSKAEVLTALEEVEVEKYTSTSWWDDDYYFVSFDSVLKKYTITQLDAVMEDVTAEFGYGDYELLSNELQFDSKQNYEDAIQYCKSEYVSQIKELKGELPTTIVLGILALIAILLSAAALVCLAICLFKAKYGLFASLACAMMGLASLLYLIMYTPSAAYFAFDVLNYPVFSFLGSPYLWGGVVFAMFACIFSGKYKKLVKFRVFAIIAAILALLLGSVDFVFSAVANATWQWYGLTVICVSLLLVPCTFTEYNGIGKYIFFNLVTVGIWQLIWVFNVTKNLNKVSAVENRKPVVELLLYMFLPFYSIYWIYKTAEAVEAYGDENGKSFKISVLCLAFAVVCPIVSDIVIQDKINKIVGKPE